MAKATAFLLFAACLLLGPELLANALTIVSREAWGASRPTRPPKQLARDPAPYIVIHHSDTPTCTTFEGCKRRVKSIQDRHMNTLNWSDIGYNFLVGQDGNVYEGRGWHVQGARAFNYSNRSVEIGFIGNFASNTPNSKALEMAKRLITYAERTRKVTPNYKLLGHRQVGETSCPGNSLYSLIKTWPHYAPRP